MTATVLGLDNKVSVSGDTMTGNLTVPSLTVTGQLNANASFETGVAPWVLGAGASFTQSSTYAYKGTYSGRLVPDGASGIVYAESEHIPCVGNESFQVQGWAMCPTGYAPGAGHGFSISVNWYDGTGAYLSTSYSYVSLAAGVWTPVTATYTSPPTATVATLTPNLDTTPPATAITYIDEVRIAQASVQNLTNVVVQTFQLPAAGVSGYVLTADAYGNGTWQPAAAGPSLPLSIANGGTGQAAAAAGFNALSPLTALGDVLYGSAANTSSRLAGNTTATRKFLRQTGTGSASAAPAWDTIVAADVPTLNQNTTGTAAGLSATLAIGSGGTGSATQNFVDLTTGQSVAGVKTFTNSVRLNGGSLTIGSASSLGDNGVGELQLANASTVPSTNPAGGGVLYAKQAVPVWLDTGGKTLGMVRTYSAIASGDATWSATESDVPGATVSVVVTGSNATVIIEGTFDALTSTAGTGTATGVGNWNGTDQSGTANWQDATGVNRAAITQNWRLTGVTAGTYTAKLRQLMTAGTMVGAFKGTHTNILVTVIEG